MIPPELEHDLLILRDRGYPYELIEDSKRVFIVFKDYPIPKDKFNITKSDLLIFTTPFYPNAGFDMFWVDERLTLANGNTPKNGNSIEQYLGRRWRRFSIHPYNKKAWNPSEDNVVSFMAYVEKRLQNGD